MGQTDSSGLRNFIKAKSWLLFLRNSINGHATTGGPWGEFNYQKIVNQMILSPKALLIARNNCEMLMYRKNKEI